MRAFYQEGPNGGELYLKETVYGEAIHLTDPGNTHFWQAMHLEDDSSGKALQFTVNGVLKSTTTVAPGVDVTFNTSDNDRYGQRFFLDPTAGLYAGPLHEHTLLTVRPGTGKGSGLAILNNGFVTYHLNRASTADAGKQAYLKVVDPMRVTHDNSLVFQVGSEEADIHKLGIPSLDALGLFGPNYQASVQTQLGSEDLIGQTDAALSVLSTVNIHVGGFSDMLGRTLTLQRSNSTSINQMLSLIADSNMPQEATDMSREQIVAQSSTAMVAQANLNEKLVLQLMR